MCRMLQFRIPLNIEAKNNKTVVWKKGNTKYDEALRLAKISAESNDRVTCRCRSKLRNDICNAVQSKQICESVTVDNIMEDEAIPPDSVKSFFKKLYTVNLLTTEELSLRKSRQVDSSAADAIFCCSAGKLIPGKQLSLGFALKFMAGSKKVLTLMNVTPSPDNGLEPYWEKKKLSITFSFSSKSKVYPSVSYLKYSNIDTL